jgi:hypothetical protein
MVKVMEAENIKILVIVPKDELNEAEGDVQANC